MASDLSDRAIGFMVERHEAGDSFESIARKMRRRNFKIVRRKRFGGETVRRALIRAGRHTPKLVGTGTKEERFREQVIVDPETGCHFWTGRLEAKGYGTTGDGELAHRFGWKLAHGDLPAGTVLHHTCRNRSCVNPAHLLPIAETGLHTILHRLEEELQGIDAGLLADIVWAFTDEEPPQLPARVGARPVSAASSYTERDHHERRPS